MNLSFAVSLSLLEVPSGSESVHKLLETFNRPYAYSSMFLTQFIDLNADAIFAIVLSKSKSCSNPHQH